MTSINALLWDHYKSSSQRNDTDRSGQPIAISLAFNMREMLKSD